jgi:hypothetical protein
VGGCRRRRGEQEDGRCQAQGRLSNSTKKEINGLQQTSSKLISTGRRNI